MFINVSYLKLYSIILLVYINYIYVYVFVIYVCNIQLMDLYCSVKLYVEMYNYYYSVIVVFNFYKNYQDNKQISYWYRELFYYILIFVERFFV